MTRFVLLFKRQKSAKENTGDFLEYLKIIGLGKRNLTVDVAYYGKIQTNLQKMLPTRAFSGAHLGYFLDDGNVEPGKAIGFFSEEDEPLVFDMALTSGVFELLFLNPHGTTLAYDTEGKPIMAKQENDVKQTNRICQAQKAAMCFVRDFSQLGAILTLAPTSKVGAISRSQVHSKTIAL